MRFALLSAAAFYAAQEASAHSWMTSAGGGEMRQGLTKSDSHNQRYYCPTPDLADCQPDERQAVRLTQADQRPCISGRSPEMGVGAPGQKMLVKWAGNGHANEQSQGTCVAIRLAKYKADPDDSDFTTLESCLPYFHGDGDTSGEVTLPSDLADGDYTVQWVWDFASYWYSTCTDISVKSGSAPATTAAPETTEAESKSPSALGAKMLDEAEKSDVKKETEVAAEHIETSDADFSKYKAEGCAALADPKKFCKALTKGRSYCKDFLPDECGRARCHRDETEFDSCADKKVLLL